MTRKAINTRVSEDTFELVELMGSLAGGIGRGKMLDAIVHYMVDKHGVEKVVEYANTIEFSDGRKKNGD